MNLLKSQFYLGSDITYINGQSNFIIIFFRCKSVWASTFYFYFRISLKFESHFNFKFEFHTSPHSNIEGLLVAESEEKEEIRFREKVLHARAFQLVGKTSQKPGIILNRYISGIFFFTTFLEGNITFDLKLYFLHNFPLLNIK